MAGWKFVAAWFLGLLPVWVYGQQVEIVGVVKDGKKPVPYATVILSNDSTARSIVAYAVTDDNGMFALRPKGRVASGWITVRCMGYATYQRLYEAFPQRTLEIGLSEDAVALSEITVKGNMYGVSLKEDTVVYTPQAFMDGSEQTMEDVLKKMPGMTVDRSGSIAYQGKKVGKVLIDGKDVLSGTDAGAMRALSADFASSVEMIANYSDGGVEDAFRTEETTALNLKSGKRGKYTGSFEGGGGVKNKFDVKSSLLRVKERHSLSVIANGNNTNEPVFSVLDYMNALGGIENIVTSSDGSTSLSLSMDEQRMLMPAANEYERLAGLGNVNVTLEPSDKYRFSIGGIYHRSTSDASSYNRDEYSLPDNEFVNQVENIGQQSNHFASFIINQTWKASAQTTLRAYTKINYGNYDFDGTVSNTYLENSVHADEGNEISSLNVTQQVAVNTLVGKGLLFGKIDFGLQDGRQDYAVRTNTSLPDVFATGEGTYFARRDNMRVNLDARVGVIYPVIGEFVNLKSEVKGGYTMDGLDNVRTTATDAEEMHVRTFSLYAGLMKNKGLFRFDAGTHLSLYSLDADLCLSDRLNKKYWRVEPMFTAALHFSQQHRLSLSMMYGYRPSGIDALSQVTVLNKYNHIQEASVYDNLLEKRWRTGLSYRYFSLFSRTTLFFYVTYDKVMDTYRQDYSSQDIISYVRNVGGGENRSVNASFYLNQGLSGVPLDIKTTVNYSYSINDLMRNSVPMATVNNLLNTSVGVSSRFRSFPVNFSLSGVYVFVDNRIAQLDAYTSTKEYGGNLQLTYTQNAFSASLTGKQRKVTNGNSDYHLNDADFVLSYKIKKFKVKISGVDIFHLDKKKWLTETVTPNMKSYIRYRQHAGYLLASLSYNL